MGALMRIKQISGLSLIMLVMVVLAGCASSRSLEAEEPDAESSENKDNIKERIRVGGIAGAATETVGWEDTISGEQADGQPFSFTEQLLRGQVAGVEVIKFPGGGFGIRIRGGNSFSGSSEPLYVVDGMPVLQRSGEGLRWLNTQDIAKIQIVKDIDARALYGARGANGVVIITTKLGQADQ